ncbi:AAA family ATPase [Marinobacter nanhaiticus D15-8W]|uniref:AAA family ATPase n=1 Tax=Marinobacter nanhaiticus TaxID=1305740 RepID=UPI0003A8BD03|nr:ATP-binding protein [Marinobacter nanhaiticus]BES72833.1 AAA family ATPase [Marinobacter nanhaiticus D15-8W]
MLYQYHYKNKTFTFSDGPSPQLENIFTVIVGKNGTGKSRLLKSIIEEFVGRSNRGGIYTNRKDLLSERSGRLTAYSEPTKIIAVSTSPFDKFPIDLHDNIHDDYSYLGLRSLRATDLGMAYMAKIFLSLITSAQEDISRPERICDVLEYLGYSPILTARYHFDIPIIKVRELFNSNNPVGHFIDEFLADNERSNPIRRSRFRSFYSDNNELSIEKIERFLDIYKRLDFSINKPRLEVVLMRDGVFLSADSITIQDDLVFLIESGLARLRNINLEKSKSHEAFRIGDASSGEQSVVMSILGIASQITDGALICIDEPEVCLHPEWQEKYIELLINTFRDYKQCHFIIATHSPLIVSKLEDENCYLMKMEDGELVHGSLVNNQSVDFQLANTFKTPGYKNEYLSRELISMLSSFGESGELDPDIIKNIKKILLLKDMLNDSDPVKKLMDMAEEVMGEVS